MMAIKLFVCIFFVLLICKIDIVRGRKLVGKEKLPLAYGDGTSMIGCPTRNMRCGGGHEYNRKEPLKENIGGMIGEDIGIRYVGDNRERTKNIQGGGCVNGHVGCNDVSRQNRNNKYKIYVNKNGYPNIENKDVTDPNLTNNINNKNDNGSRNNIGNGSGSNNGKINGNIFRNGNTVNNGDGSVNDNSVGIGDESGKGNNGHYREISPPTHGSN
ncbi:unnamed protein product [Lactuca virosa]|uniref:Uncharacterized protein n=1 Tax=Lactuca virosa TaxID=75947 RepID=A0AAU9PAH0_9ASTR|nr:unnamed protein product [Lactuca virosa]